MKRWIAASIVVVAVIAAAPAVLGWILQHPLAARLSTRWMPPDAPLAGDVSQQQQERAALQALGKEVRGQLIWSSNRGGNHDLYRVDLASGRMTQLTTHPHVDYLSRYSPDGRQISFLRSKRPWVSFREVDGWDLYVMKSDGTGERRLAERAYHNAWTPDGRELTFVRDNRAMAVNVESGRERLLHDGKAAPTEGDIDAPEMGPDGQLALALRGVGRDRRGVGIVSLPEKRFTRVSATPSACQISWIADQSRVVWVESSGRGGTEIFHMPRNGKRAEVLIDLPGAFSHEYFPRVTRDGRWLVWAAAAEGHEHDRADYEIFVWQIGTPWDRARRITYAASNDQWPDLYVE